MAAIAAIAHAAGALVYVDGVHRTPHEPVDVAALGADFYVTSAYKWSGPHIAACVADPALWERLRPDKLVPSPDDVPERFEHGTQSFELLAGVTGAVDHLAALVAHGTRPTGAPAVLGLDGGGPGVRAWSFSRRCWPGCATSAGVTICPAPARRLPDRGVPGRRPAPGRTAEILGDEGICVFAGDYYAYEYFQAMGLRDSGGAVRASIYHYTTAGRGGPAARRGQDGAVERTMNA